MPALNFKAEFADAVKRLEKRQTIRARGKRKPPRVGDPLMLYTGMRQAGCRKLLDAVCIAIDGISISTRSKTVQMPYMLENGESMWALLPDHEIEALAKADGFASADAFFAWFGKTYGDSFSGYVIKW
ncbi:hypothetical protein SFMTTN_2067 [Sulfuriferula multivorans]|uniref:ASCH domain-containing protein n=1 Tax=Sulfuriferula multivorans TaxID=1559896 RepID=A0A401JF81_9PROT|nr:hypothetical protein [Sulfuriferula multivorans]GBL46254.1 hypothetical protein SFMTTN_2067 [Sulfuriferula multivorans]